MSTRMKKALLALGMMTAAGPSFAMYVVGSGIVGGYGGYCGKVLYPDSTSMGVMTNTILNCQTQLKKLMDKGGYSAFEACNSCNRLFEHLSETAYGTGSGGTGPTGTVLDPEVAQRFLEGTQRLREQFRIDEYENAQKELQRAVQPSGEQ